MAPQTEVSAADHTIRLLDYEAELAGDLCAERRDEARNSALARVLTVPRGPWNVPALQDAQRCSYGLLVLEGLVTRTALLGGDDASAQLLGRGDLIRSGDTLDEVLVPVAISWMVREPLKVALLDEQFLLTVRRWPEVVAALFDRIAAQAVRLGTHRALCQLPRVEDRIHALMWFLAERWGRVTPQGVILPLKLTHELVGQLVGAKRPTVSLAIKELEGRGTVHRRADGAWLLEQRWDRGDLSGPITQASAGFVAAAPGSPIFAGASGNRNGNRNGNGASHLRVVPPPQPADAPPSFAEIRQRIERMRERHERSMYAVDSVLARSAEAQRRSLALRDRIGRRRHREVA